MSKQTAVEWLYQHLFPKQLDGFSKEEWNKIDTAFDQAKQMEKEQIVDGWLNGMKGEMIAPLSINNYKPEDYYNETYGGK